MKKVRSPEEVVNSKIIKPGSRIYASGDAGTPQRLLAVLATDENIQEVELTGVLLLGDIDALFSEAACRRITHRVIFNGPASREAVNQGRAKYQLLHLSDIPRQLRRYLKPDVAMITVSGPDNGGNYSLGTTVEAVPAAVETVKQNAGVVIAPDQVVIITEHGAFDPRGLSFSERVIAIAHLAEPETRELLIKRIYDSPEYHHPAQALKDGVPKGIIPYQAA